MYINGCYAALIKLGISPKNTNYLLSAGIGAGVGAAGGAFIGGEDNRATGALGGALVGAGAGALGHHLVQTPRRVTVTGGSRVSWAKPPSSVSNASRKKIEKAERAYVDSKAKLKAMPSEVDLARARARSRKNIEEVRRVTPAQRNAPMNPEELFNAHMKATMPNGKAARAARMANPTPEDIRKLRAAVKHRVMAGKHVESDVYDLLDKFEKRK
jgi:hypothetical protein